jgi:glycosyltransferase involved in cell wall biosynthesis
VNNCSSDGSLEIANRYAQQDDRISVITNTKFVGVIENHNIGISLISAKSKYCKVVSADDRIVEDAVTKMVKLAEEHPAVAIVGCYQVSGENIRWKGLPFDREVVSGREVCRLSLLDGLNVFGTPTSLLYRSDIASANKPFYPHSLPHAYTSACYKYLQSHDFGFVHEVLCEERIHPHQTSAKVKRMGLGNIAFLADFLTYGPVYLNEIEFEERKRHLFLEYYRWLGGNILKMEGREFWKQHSSRLRDLGYPIQWAKVLNAALHEIIDEIQNPRVAFEKLYAVVMLRHENRYDRGGE